MGLLRYCFGWRKLAIRPGDLVLEVGPGENPLIRSDVLVDKYLTDDTERGGSLVMDRPLVIADVCALPFKDKAFDYAYTAHTLEHVDDVEKAFGELSRVAKRDCIVVPHWSYEGLWNKDYHLWLISTRDGVLVFRRKCQLFAMAPSEHRAKAKELFWRLYSRHRETFEVRYEWEGRIDYEIVRCGCGDFNPTHRASVEKVVRKSLPLKARLKRWGRVMVTRWLRWLWRTQGVIRPL